MRNSRTGWLVVAGISATIFVIMGPSVSIVATLLPHAVAEFHSSSSEASAAMSAFAFGMLITSWPAGWIADRIGPRPVMFFGLLLTTVGCLLGAGSGGMKMFVAAIATIAAGVGAIVSVPAILIVTSWMSERRATAVSITMCAAAAGMAIGPILTSQLAELFSWQTVMAFAAFAMAVLGAPLIAASGRLPTDSGQAAERGGGTGGGTGFPPISRDYVLVTLTLILSGVAYTAMYFHTVLFLASAGFPSSQSAYVFSAMNVAGFVGYLLVGVLADRIGAKQMLTLSMLVAAVSILPLLFIEYQPLRNASVVIFVVLWGMLSNQASQLSPVLIANITEEKHFGTLMGASSFLSGIFAVTGPIAVGAIKDQTNHYQGGLLLCGVLMALAALSAWLIGRAAVRAEVGLVGR